MTFLNTLYWSLVNKVILNHQVVHKNTVHFSFTSVFNFI